MKKTSILFLLLFSFAISMSTLIAADKTDDHIIEFMVEEQSAEAEKSEKVENEKPDIHPSLLTEHFSTLSLEKPESALVNNNAPLPNPPFEPPQN